MEIDSLPLDQRVARMRDPEFRARLLSEGPILGPLDPPMLTRKFELIIQRADDIFISGYGTPDYEPDRANSVKAIAEREGKTVHEVFYDLFTKDDGRHLVYFPTLNFRGGNLDEQFAI